MRRLSLYPEPPAAALELEAPLALDPGCQACSMHEGVHTPCMPADGEPGGLLVVGEAPGRAEDSVGRPFIGEAGKFLRPLISRWWNGPVAFASALGCAPGRREVKHKHVDTCRGYLAQAALEVRPTRVIALGSWAAYSVLGRSCPALSMRRAYSWLVGQTRVPIADHDVAGAVFHDGPAVPVFMLIHPSSALRNRFVRGWFEADLEWALSIELPLPAHWRGSAHLVDTVEDAEQAARDLRAAGSFSLDFETAGRMHDSDFRATSAACAAPGSIDAFVWDDRALAAPAIREPLARLISDPTVGKHGQYVQFDLEVAELALGARARNVTGDCGIQRKLLDPDAAGDLGSLSELVGMGGYKEEMEDLLDKAVRAARKGVFDPEAPLLPGDEAFLRLGGDVERVKYALAPRSTLSVYNARDAVVTSALAVEMDARMTAGPAGIRGVWESLTRPAIPAFVRMEMNGALIDVGAIESFARKLDVRQRDVKGRLDACAPGINVDSPKQLAAFLYGACGLAPPHLTAKGAPSTDADALDDLRGQHPIVDDLLAWRKLDKLRGTYVDGGGIDEPAFKLGGGGLLQHVRGDGRVHPRFFLDGARSGRTSCVDPNCFSGDTEVLTREGWVRFDALAAGVEVAQWDGHVVSFVLPTARQRFPHVGDMVHLTNQHINLLVTPDHRCLLRHRRTGALRVFEAQEYPEGWHQLHGGYYDGSGELEVTRDELVLLCATQADGSWSHGGIDFGFRKARKIARLVGALNNLESEYSLNAGKDGRVRVRVRKGPLARRMYDLLGPSKSFGSWVLHLSRERLDEFCDEVFLWDGCATRMSHYSSNQRTNADWVQIALMLSGKRARIRLYQGSRNMNYQVDVIHRDYSLTTNIVSERVPWDGEVFCVSVPSSYLLVRRGGEACITGQCQNMPSEKTEDGKIVRDFFVAPPGWVLLSADESQVELRVLAALSGDPAMCELFRAGVDFHQQTALMISRLAWGIPPEQVTPEHRRMAKTVNFALAYGKTAPTLALELGISTSEAEAVVQAILGKFTRFAEWRRERIREAHRTGEVWTWWAGGPARRRPLHRIADQGREGDAARSKAENGSVNSPIQGSASDVCLASTIECQRWLEEDCVPARLILTVHDQLLFEVRKDAVAEVAWQVRRIMTQWKLPHDVPLAVDVEVGKSWGSLKKFNPDAQG